MTSFEDIIKAKGSLVYHNKGTSMLPLIKEGRDLLVIEAPTYPICKYDIVLSKRPSGRYLLHRVIKVCNNGTYIIAGDNSWKSDTVTEHSIVGVMTGLIRNSNSINLSSPLYRLLTIIWCELFFARKLALRFCRVIMKMS